MIGTGLSPLQVNAAHALMGRVYALEGSQSSPHLRAYVSVVNAIDAFVENGLVGPSSLRDRLSGALYELRGRVLDPLYYQHREGSFGQAPPVDGSLLPIVCRAYDAVDALIIGMMGGDPREIFGAMREPTRPLNEWVHYRIDAKTILEELLDFDNEYARCLVEFERSGIPLHQRRDLLRKLASTIRRAAINTICSRNMNFGNPQDLAPRSLTVGRELDALLDDHVLSDNSTSSADPWPQIVSKAEEARALLTGFIRALS